jgi:hypothetical protein
MGRLSRAQYVQYHRNVGWPKGRETQGHGAAVGVGGKESLLRGEGQQVSDILKGEGCEMHNYLNRSGMSSTGELIDTEKVTISSEGRRWKSACKSNSLASYPTLTYGFEVEVRGGNIPIDYN